MLMWFTAALSLTAGGLAVFSIVLSQRAIGEANNPKKFVELVELVEMYDQKYREILRRGQAHYARMKKIEKAERQEAPETPEPLHPDVPIPDQPNGTLAPADDPEIANLRAIARARGML